MWHLYNKSGIFWVNLDIAGNHTSYCGNMHVYQNWKALCIFLQDRLACMENLGSPACIVNNSAVLRDHYFKKTGIRPNYLCFLTFVFSLLRGLSFNGNMFYVPREQCNFDLLPINYTQPLWCLNREKSIRYTPIHIHCTCIKIKLLYYSHLLQ